MNTLQITETKARILEDVAEAISDTTGKNIDGETLLYHLLYDLNAIVNEQSHSHNTQHLREWLAAEFQAEALR